MHKQKTRLRDGHLTGVCLCVCFKIYITCLPRRPKHCFILWASIRHRALFVAVKHLCNSLHESSPRQGEKPSLTKIFVCTRKKELCISSNFCAEERNEWSGGPAGTIRKDAT